MSFELRVVNNTELNEHWDKLKPDVIRSFSKSDFLGNYNCFNVAHEIETEFNSIENGAIKHFLIEDSKNEIVAALFCISQSHNSFDFGWLFTKQELSNRNRIICASVLIEAAHELVLNAGYKKVIIEIGTQIGKKILTKKYGYSKYGSPETNKWIKILKK